MKKLIIATILCMAFASPARSEFFTGNTLFRICSSGEFADIMDCLGYTTGASDAAQWRHFCPSEGITRGQIRDIVFAYLRDNPEVRNQTADLIVAAALKRVWPCQQSNQRRGGSA